MNQSQNPCNHIRPISFTLVANENPHCDPGRGLGPHMLWPQALGGGSALLE